MNFQKVSSEHALCPAASQSLTKWGGARHGLLGGSVTITLVAMCLQLCHIHAIRTLVIGNRASKQAKPCATSLPSILGPIIGVSCAYSKRLLKSPRAHASHTPHFRAAVVCAASPFPGVKCCPACSSRENRVFPKGRIGNN